MKMRISWALVLVLLLTATTAIPHVIQAATVRSNQPFGLCSLRVGTETQPDVPCPVLVIGDPNSVTMVVYAETDHHTPLKTIHVTDRSEVSALVDQPNHLRWYPRGVGLPCPYFEGPYIALHFAYANDDRWTVGVQSYECQLVTSHHVGALAAGTDLGKYLASLGATLPTRKHAAGRIHCRFGHSRPLPDRHEPHPGMPAAATSPVS